MLGAGFSPEAVLGDEVEKKNDTRNRQPHRHPRFKSSNERIPAEHNWRTQVMGAEQSERPTMKRAATTFDAANLGANFRIIICTPGYNTRVRLQPSPAPSDL